MKMISRFFLRAEHWQVFLIVMGTYVGGSVAMAYSFPTLRITVGIDTKRQFLAGAMMAVAMSGLLAWFYSIGYFFNSITRPELRLKTSFFLFSVGYPPIFFAFYLGNIIGDKTRIGAFIFPLLILYMVCILYLLYFVSKSLVLAETEKPATFYEFAGPFFLLWIFPIGIWYVQPRVNRLYAERKNPE